MTQISTPYTQGPKVQTLDNIRRFARTYKPQPCKQQTVVILLADANPIGEC